MLMANGCGVGKDGSNPSCFKRAVKSGPLKSRHVSGPNNAPSHQTKALISPAVQDVGPGR